MELFLDHNQILQILYKDQDLFYLLKIAVDNLIIIQNSLTNDDINKLEKYSFKNLKLEISEFVNYYIPYKKINHFPEKLFLSIVGKIFIILKFLNFQVLFIKILNLLI